VRERRGDPAISYPADAQFGNSLALPRSRRAVPAHFHACPTQNGITDSPLAPGGPHHSVTYGQSQTRSVSFVGRPAESIEESDALLGVDSGSVRLTRFPGVATVICTAPALPA
jgi:hypothetical protein